jgi:diguanylate cyclase
MKYTESIEKSGEYLRLVLPLMAKHAAGFHPVSYAVWYEYVAGINKPLKAAIDELTRNSALLDEAAITGLYQKFISDFDEEASQRLRAGFQTVLANMSQSATEAGDQAFQFGQKLEQLNVGLKNSPSVSASTSVIDNLLSGTHQMQGAIGSLTQQLEESQNKIKILREEVEKAREDALADGLTGLTNRRGLDLAIASCIVSAGEHGHTLSLLMADIDHFKQVNDTYGHLFGDKVIRNVAKILKDNIKGKDTAARYGGEEFVVLLPDTPLEGARCVAERIRSTVEASRIRRTDTNQEIAKITVSFGVASYCAGETASEFIERVDGALYASKTGGRNRVTVASAVKAASGAHQA